MSDKQCPWPLGFARRFCALPPALAQNRWVGLGKERAGVGTLRTGSARRRARSPSPTTRGHRQRRAWPPADAAWPSTQIPEPFSILPIMFKATVPADSDWQVNGGRLPWRPPSLRWAVATSWGPGSSPGGGGLDRVNRIHPVAASPRPSTLDVAPAPAVPQARLIALPKLLHTALAWSRRVCTNATNSSSDGSWSSRDVPVVVTQQVREVLVQLLLQDHV